MKYKIDHYEVNTKGNDFIVGDIHGNFSKLGKQLEDIGFCFWKDRLFSTGDLVDRGDESEEVIKWLEYDWFHPVIGNHEEFIIRMDECGYNACHIRNGGLWFAKLTVEKQRKIQSALMELPIVITVDTEHCSRKIGIVHAEYPCNDWNFINDVVSDENQRDMMLWSRDKYELKDQEVVRNIDRIYVGHTPTKQLELLGNTWYMDSGVSIKEWNADFRILKID